MPPLIQGNNVEAVNESRDHRVKPVGMGGAAVEEAEGRTSRLAPFERPESHAVDDE